MSLSRIEKNTFSTIIATLFLLYSCFCATADDFDDEEEFFTATSEKSTSTKGIDPFESFNRKIFSFNTKVWDDVLVPAATWYNDTIPLAVRFTFKNIMQNYTTNTNDIILSTLDFDLEAITITFWRWAINSFFGVFGGDDVANDTGLKSYGKSIGKILHFYHIPRGPYVMLPFIGPSNTRDSIGLVGFTLLTSSFCWSYIFQLRNHSYIISYLNLTSFWHIPFRSNNDLTWISFGHSTGYYIHSASTQGTVINFLSASAIDRYVNFRTAYFQTLDKEEEEYTKDRMEGKSTRRNACDYDAMIDFPEGCYDDPKEYSLTYTKF